MRKAWLKSFPSLTEPKLSRGAGRWCHSNIVGTIRHAHEPIFCRHCQAGYGADRKCISNDRLIRQCTARVIRCHQWESADAIQVEVIELRPLIPDANTGVWVEIRSAEQP